MWAYGDNTSITEQSPFHAPALVAWKEPIERRVLGATGMRAVIVTGVVVREEGRDAVAPDGPLPGRLLRGGRAA